MCILCENTFRKNLTKVLKRCIFVEKLLNLKNMKEEILNLAIAKGFNRGIDLNDSEFAQLHGISKWLFVEYGIEIIFFSEGISYYCSVNGVETRNFFNKEDALEHGLKVAFSFLPDVPKELPDYKSEWTNFSNVELPCIDSDSTSKELKKMRKELKKMNEVYEDMLTNLNKLIEKAREEGYQEGFQDCWDRRPYKYI